MLEFVPLIFAIVGLAVVFYMFKAIIVFIGDELANTAEAYNEDTTHISKQLYELNQSLQNQVKAMTIELKQSTSHYRQSVAYVAQEFDKLSDEIRKIKESVERQQELENEIMRLKSILGRKEKKMSDVAQKHAHINIYIDIVCAVVIRIDKMGFHRRYDFACLYAGDLLICRSWGDAVEWCEIFNAFCRNALSKNTEYPIDNSIVFDYGLHNGSPTLRMLLKNRTGALQQYTFSKLECLQIYSKMSKILSKCDLVSQGGY